ncbi:HSP20-like chaperone [Lentinus tigrinus ALCF2SS1-7]|uniref:HSP20-like chaperone n=1 Tax=Lentinus tigrinus ALCF2SS1-6 TaxID=1328759 RepID=A0A5C2S5T9_9APHY|nr:HSP20-like chaperone [Lentinus tigrinus ALCF2SS1-6]RPD72784.1 HSP20-like chaperone [Lentinus tigrinus ALCF2SS1-7]
MSLISTFFNDPLYTEFDRLFDDAFSRRTQGGNGTQVARQDAVPRLLRPAIDLHEDAEKNVVTATFELPGLKKEDVSIDVHNNILTVSGETKKSEERTEEGYVVKERRYGKFSRTIPVAQGIKPEEIKASLENGVLTVKFPRTTPEQAPKKITVS